VYDNYEYNSTRRSFRVMFALAISKSIYGNLYVLC